MNGLQELLQSRRARLVAVLAVATVAIGALAISAAGSSLSFYQTPEEWKQQIGDAGDGRYRIGARVVEGSVIEENGRPVEWLVEGESGETVRIHYDGIVPSLFGPRAFIVVEGVADEAGGLVASSVIVRHEPEFVTDPDDASIAPADE